MKPQPTNKGEEMKKTTDKRDTIFSVFLALIVVSFSFYAAWRVSVSKREIPENKDKTIRVCHQKIYEDYVLRECDERKLIEREIK